MDKLTLYHSLHPTTHPLYLTPGRDDSTLPSVLRVRDTMPDVLVSSSSDSPYFASPARPSLNPGSPAYWDELKSLSSVKLMHTQIIKTPNLWNSETLAENLIAAYMGFGDYRSSVLVFFVGCAGNYVPWHSFLRYFESSGGSLFQILEIFCEFYSKGMTFDCRVLSSVLRTSAVVMCAWLGVEIHALIIKKGFDMDSYLMCSLMNFYGRCWGIDSANQVFDEIPEKVGSMWNDAVMANVQSERPERAFQLLQEMQFSCVKPSSYAIVKLLQACGDKRALDAGKQIHGYVLRLALALNVFICNSLITMYAKNNKLKLAKRVFDSMENTDLSSWNSIISGYAVLGHMNDAWNLLKEMKSADMKPDVVTWNCLLSGHVQCEMYREVLIILRRMQDEGFKPNATSITKVLQAISGLGFYFSGKETHGYVIRNGLEYDAYVGTSLVDMYVKNDDLYHAQAAFNCMKKRNVFAWNSLISGILKGSLKGSSEDALRLLDRMNKEGVQPDLVTWNGFVSRYSMRGQTKEAIAMIHYIKSVGLTPNVVSWTALISGCSKTGKYRDSIESFIQMQKEGVEPNSATISCLLQACAGLSLLQKGKEIHCLSIRKGFIDDVFVATALTDMYSRSGSLKNAFIVFGMIKDRTLASWNCMMMGFAIHGLGRKAILLFEEMVKLGIRPDAITFTALLSNCKNSGLVDEGWKFFDSMETEYNIIPTVEHYSCMVDLLARSNYLDEALDFIEKMPVEPDATTWGALLGSSRTHRNIEIAEIAAEKLFELEPHNSANYVLMMNLYAVSKRWKDVDRLCHLMRASRAKSGDIWSWIQIDQKLHVFTEEGEPHPDEGEIYFELYNLVSEMKRRGYVPDTDSVYQNVDEKDKEAILLSHTEKLAIAYGLIKIKNNAPIRVIKNTRVCSDCHTAAKYITLVKGREIFLKDGVRIHQFKGGRCSCNDCW